MERPLLSLDGVRGSSRTQLEIEQGAQLFVAALGASSYIYAEADLDAGARRLDRLAHTRFRFAGQVPYDTKACPGHRAPGPLQADLPTTE
jgi:hypothetical protein